MKREFLFACYQTPRGKLLRDLEIEYLKHAIDAGCKESILQIGGLDWENEFIDCSLFQRFFILDKAHKGWDGAKNIQARAFSLPIQTESMDWIILPHLLEFDAHRFQTLREIERVLKPEGHLIILNFNPWSVWLRSQYLWDKRLADSWYGHFIARSRLLDWMKLLNFEVRTHTEFNLTAFKTSAGACSLSKDTFLATTYALKVVKRRYTLIPLNSDVAEMTPIQMSRVLESSQKQREYDR